MMYSSSHVLFRVEERSARMNTRLIHSLLRWRNNRDQSLVLTMTYIAIMTYSSSHVSFCAEGKSARWMGSGLAWVKVGPGGGLNSPGLSITGVGYRFSRYSVLSISV
jgi:hypothetical protein